MDHTRRVLAVIIAAVGIVIVQIGITFTPRMLPDFPRSHDSASLLGALPAWYVHGGWEVVLEAPVAQKRL